MQGRQVVNISRVQRGARVEQGHGGDGITSPM